MNYDAFSQICAMQSGKNLTWYYIHGYAFNGVG